MSVRNYLDRMLRGLHSFELTLLAVILIAMVLVATTQILLRNFFDMGLIWADPLLRIMLLWLGLLGAVAASHDDKHISIDLLSQLVPASWLSRIRIITSFFTAVVCVIVAYHSARFVIDEYHYASVAFSGLPSWVLQIIIPIAFSLIALRYFLLMGRYWLHKPVGAVKR